MDFVGKQPGKDTLTGNGLNTIRGHVRKSPNKIAVRTENESLTYNQLWQRSIKLANSMIGQGINKNDLIITYMPNCPQYIEIAIAAEMIGSPVTLGNYRLKGEEIAYQINDCRAALIFVHADLLPAVLKMKETIPSVRYIIVIGDNPKDDVENYEVFLERGSVTGPEIKVFPDDLHALFYTSGTTGKQKVLQEPSTAITTWPFQRASNWDSPMKTCSLL